MSKMARVSPFQAIIMVNAKGLNAPIERHSVVEWEKQMNIQTKNKSWGLLKRDSLQLQDTQIESAGKERDISSKWKAKEREAAILASVKTDLKPKTMCILKPYIYLSFYLLYFFS